MKVKNYIIHRQIKSQDLNHHGTLFAGRAAEWFVEWLSRVRLTADQLTPENLQKFEAAQRQLQTSLGRLLAVAENYPQLKANENFRDLQAQLEGTENRIAIARRRYIDQIREFNDLVTVPPTSWTNALLYHKQPKAQFTATTPGAEKAPQVKS